MWQLEYFTVLRWPALFPVDNVHQLPGILAQLKLQLTLLVDNQLASEIENACALVRVGIVQVEYTRGKTKAVLGCWRRLRRT